jgi:hypothetical protein
LRKIATTTHGDSVVTDQELMQSIKTKWGDLLDSACKTSSVPPAFLAALVANESGGNPDAKRFEPGVLAQLFAVLLNRKAFYGSIARDNIIAFAQGVSVTVNMQFIVALDQLSTSWGLVQVMGYEAIALHTNGVAALQSPASEMAVATRMLADFSRRYQLDLAKDFSELFGCWNTGRPHSPTADPNYIPNGLARMELYRALP